MPNNLSPNAMWEKLGCTIDRAYTNPKRPLQPVRTIRDCYGRVVSCHASGDRGYDFEHSIASWMLGESL